jgi:hypothetical protein
MIISPAHHRAFNGQRFNGIVFSSFRGIGSAAPKGRYPGRPSSGPHQGAAGGAAMTTYLNFKDIVEQYHVVTGQQNCRNRDKEVPRL